MGFGAIVAAARGKGVSLPVPLVYERFTGADGAALPGIWTAQVGTYQINTNKGRASAIAAAGRNFVTNGEFTVDLAGWGTENVTMARVDAAVDPAVTPTGGSDDFAALVTCAVVGNSYGKIYYTTATIRRGINYRAAARVYSPSTNSYVKAARFRFLQAGAGHSMAMPSAEDVWEDIVDDVYITTTDGTDIWLQLYIETDTIGDLGYYDKVSVKWRMAIATCNPGVAAADVRVKVTMPASGVIPFGVVARYQDENNYWLWLVTPGTAGTDFELLEVNAGVMTSRASADVDWAAGQTYNLRFTHSAGNVFTAYADGVQKLTYTDGSAFLAAQTLFGLWEGSTGRNLFDDFKIYGL